MKRIVLVLPLALISGLETRNGAPTAKSTTAPLPVLLVAVGDAPLPTQDDMARLVKADPLAALEACLARYHREVKGYSAVFEKHDIPGNDGLKKEVADIHFRDKPHSVYMAWTEGMGRAEAVLFVEDENENRMLVRPAGRLLRRLIVSRPVDGDPADAGLFNLRQFGFKRTTERTVKEWRQLREKGELQVEYLGVKRLKEAGDCPCWVWRQLVKKPGADRIAQVFVWIDTATWLQVGTELKDARGKPLGSYYFRNVKLNPKFQKGQFQREGLKP